MHITTGEGGVGGGAGCGEEGQVVWEEGEVWGEGQVMWGRDTRQPV